MSELSTSVEATAEAAQKHADGLVDALRDRGWNVATAESLTGGAIATLLAAAPGAGDWFRGGVVAYSPEVKFDLLGVPCGPVVTQECAATMATATARLLGADVCVAVTGVGGPDPDEGQPAGTVWLAVRTPEGVRTEKQHFDGDPPDVLTATTARAMEMLQEVVRRD